LLAAASAGGEVVGVVMQAASEKETKVSVIRRIGILLSLR